MIRTAPRIPIRPRTLAVLLVSIVALIAAPAANAATVGFDYHYGTLYFVAAPGETNNLTISGNSSGYQLSDSVATLSTQSGCTLVDAHHATCPGTYVKWLYVTTSDGDDTLSLQSMTWTFVDCGTGTDTLNTPNTAASVRNCELVNAPPAAPPAAPTPPAVTPPPLSIGQPAATMTQGGDVPLTLSCSATATSRCTGTIVLELPTKASKSEVGAARRGAPNILGKDKFSVAQGKKRKVSISMTGKGRGMVKRRGKLRVTAKLKVKQGGKTTVLTQSLTIKAPRHHR